uniref:Uncharacterized protein n=1 Tax=Arundo donax TaxID=35708 RepID=A0A0A9HD18_ARUDO
MYAVNIYQQTCMSAGFTKPIETARKLRFSTKPFRLGQKTARFIKSNTVAVLRFCQKPLGFLGLSEQFLRF